MAKGRLTISVEDDLIKKMKISAIEKDTNVTTIVEKLISEYLRLDNPEEYDKANKLQNPIEFIPKDTTDNNQ